MAWNNPTPQEAADEVAASKKRYNDAAARNSTVRSAIADYRSEMSASNRAMDSCRRDKLNFETRLEQIKEVVGILEGSGGGLAGSIGADVPTLVSQLRQQTAAANASFGSSMKSPDIPAANIEDSLGCPDASQDMNIQLALQMFKAEQARLEGALEELANQIKQLEARTDELTAKLNQLTAEQADLRKIMISSIFDMKHFRSFF